jgi:hypothetical protein
MTTTDRFVLAPRAVTELWLEGGDDRTERRIPEHLAVQDAPVIQPEPYQRPIDEVVRMFRELDENDTSRCVDVQIHLRLRLKMSSLDASASADDAIPRVFFRHTADTSKSIARICRMESTVV